MRCANQLVIDDQPFQNEKESGTSWALNAGLGPRVTWARTPQRFTTNHPVGASCRILNEPKRLAWLFAEEYATAEQAEAHVRRLLDILACTTAFARPRDGAAKHRASKHGRPATPPSSPTPASTGAHGVASGEAAPPISEAHDMAAIRPPPKLGEFYDFFSFAHLTPPVHCEDPHYADEAFRFFRVRWSVLSFILTRGARVVSAVIRRKEANGASQEGDHFEIEVSFQPHI
jgi:hypothetical protein